MNENTVAVKSLISGTVVLSLPEFHYRRVWSRKGAVQYIEKDILRNNIYDEGVLALFKDGDLFIEDMEFKKQIGLQSMDAQAPTIIQLDDKLCNRLIKLMPVHQISETLKKLSISQREELVTYAVQHFSDLQMDRINIIDKICKVNLLKKIETKKAAQEA